MCLSMGSGASVLQGGQVCWQINGGVYGYNIAFPLDHPTWDEGMSESDDSVLDNSRSHDAFEGFY
jgi:hypothetical protein